MVGTNTDAISRIENGGVSPTIDFFEKIADALDSMVEIGIITKATLLRRDEE